MAFINILILQEKCFSQLVKNENTLQYALENDSLSNQSFEELENKYYSSGNNYLLSNIYANSYIEKAKRLKNKKRLGHGYYLLSQITEEKRSIELADSIIKIAKITKNNDLWIKGYLQQGIQYYYLANYDKALTTFLKAQEIALTDDDKFQQVVIRHHIGNLKNVTNQKDEALEIFRSNIKYFEKGIANNEEKRQYFKSLFRLANIYNITKKLDSAEIINIKGIKESLAMNDPYMYPKFLACYGSTLQLKGNNERALDTLIKSARINKHRKARLASIYLIICKVYHSQKRFDKYEKNLLKIDSLYKSHPEVIKQAKIAYRALINLYKKEGKQQNQLIYMDKLIELDTILDVKYLNVNKNIARKYEIKKIVDEKQKVIDQLDEKKKNYYYIFSFLFLLLLLSTYIIISFNKKKKLYQTRYENLINEYNNSTKTKKLQNKSVEKRNNSVPEDVQEKILNELANFEDNKEFLNKNVSAKFIAQAIGTNTTYLSFVVNNYKDKNLSRYISDLRVEYSIQRMIKDKKFRAYSIKAIASEVGFKSQEAFSKAFYRMTGIYPSYFIDNLNKK